jgi:diguanylate cyclase (GGDEF)-like protein
MALDPKRSIDQYTLRSWSLDEGFPQTSANSIVQGPEGYMYVATFGGLVRFDGVRVAIIPTDGSCSNRLYSLEVGENGVIWAGTERSGLCRVENGVLVAFPMPDGADIGGVTTIRRIRDGSLWVGGVTGLTRITEDRVERFDSAVLGLPGPFVATVDEARDGTLWVGTDEGLCLLKDGRCRVPAWAGAFEGRAIETIRHAADGATWIGVEQELFKIVLDRAEKVDLPPGPRRVRTILEDRDGNVWLGMDPGGLWRVVPRVESLDRMYSLVTDVVASLFEDREGNLWAGYSGSGLVKLSNGRAISLRLPSAETSAPTVSVIGDRNGGAWVGTACAGLAHVTADGIRMFDEDDGLGNLCVWSLLADPEGGLWIGTHGDGLYRMRPDRSIETRNGPDTREQVVRALEWDEDGMVLVGTDQGLFRHDRAAGTFTVVAGTEGADVYFVDQAEDGAVWIGTRQGALVVRQSGVEKIDRASGLSSDYVRAILRDPDGVVWIGTYGGGLNRLEGGNVTVFDTRNGLPDNVVSRIVEDPSGRFWMTANRGVMRVSRRQLEAMAAGRATEIKVDLFDAQDGMPVSETNGGSQPAGALLDDGRLWVPTVDGIAIFDTNVEVENVLPPSVRIEEVVVDGASVETEGSVVLSPGARNLEIHYTALSFRSPERVRFRYRLEGFDERWVDAGTRRVAYYPVIPAGELTFHVIACNDEGVWNEEGATFAFTLEPRFVETWWFYGLIALLAALLGGLMIRLRGVASERGRRRLELQVERRTSELSKLAELTEQINQAVTLEEVLDHVYDSLRAVIPYDRIGLALLDENRIVLRAVWSRSESENVAIGEGYEASLEGSSLMKVLESGEPRVIEDLEKYLEEHPNSESTKKILSEGIRSSMTCPLKALGRPVGFLFFSSAKTGTYRESHVRFLQQIAGQLSLVVGKSKIYEDLLETKRRLEQANRNLESLAAADGLTGIANRRSFEHKLEEEWRRAIRSKSHLSLLMIDVDFFKAYNDRYGHTVGDDCLRTIATVLAANLRRVSDMVARFGGEEFAVILPETDELSAKMMAERLRAGIESLRMEHGGSEITNVVTISVGGATIVPTNELRKSELIEAADQELYEAKREGRNRTSHRDVDADRVEITR